MEEKHDRIFAICFLSDPFPTFCHRLTVTMATTEIPPKGAKDPGATLKTISENTKTNTVASEKEYAKLV